MSTYNVDVIADIKKYASELSKLEGITEKEANKAALKLATSIQAGAKKAVKDANDELKGIDASDAFGKVGESAGKLGGALGLIPGPAGEAARTVADLADVGEVGAEAIAALGKKAGLSRAGLTALGAGAGVAGAAALALGAAWLYASQQAEELERMQRSLEGSTARVADAHLLQAQTADKLAVLTGTLTSAQAQQREVERQRAQDVADATAATQERVKALEAETSAMDRRGVRAANQAAIVAEKKALEETTSAINAAAAAKMAEIGQSESLRRSTEEEAKAEREAAKAKAAAAAASAQRARLTAEEQRRLQELTDTLNALDDIEKQHTDARLRLSASELEQLQMDREAAASAAEHAAVQRLETTELTTAEELQIEKEFQEALRAIHDRYDAEDRKVRQEQAAEKAAEEQAAFEEQQRQLQEIETWKQQAHDAEIARIQAERSARLDTLSITFDLATQGAQVAADAIDLILEHQGVGDERRAELVKKIALFEAAVNTAAGVTKALGSAAPPINFIQAALVGAAGAIQIAKIKSTQYHRGGIAGDEVPSTLQRGEGVLTRQAVNRMGQDEVRRMNAGFSRQVSPDLPYILQLGGKTMQAGVLRASRQAGPTRRLLRGSSMPWRQMG